MLDTFRRPPQALHVDGDVPVSRVWDRQPYRRALGEAAIVPVPSAAPIRAKVGAVEKANIGGTARECNLNDVASTPMA